MFLCVVSAYAQSFEKDGLSYNVIKQQDAESPGEVEVRQSLSEGDGECGGYAGDIVIPAEVIYDDQTYEVTRIGNWAFRLCTNLSSITIPEGVTFIGDAAFFGCTNLSSVTIPNSVTTIEGHAFGECSSLTSVILGQKLTTIETGAFISCSSLSSITIPNSVEAIGDRAFDSCSLLTSVILGNQLTTIGKETFQNCPSLSSITIPNSVTSIGRYAFSGSSNMTSIVVESENSKYDSRNNCNAIIETETNTLLTGSQNTVIPSGVTTISANAFNGCSGLTSITIPSSVTSIGENAFYGCSGLEMLTSEISTPFEVNAFNSFDATLVVPMGKRTDYKNTNGWKEFAFTFEEGETIYDREQTDKQGLYYTLKQADDYSVYYSVAGHSDEMKTEIVIPANLGGCPVGAVGTDAFKDCKELTSVKMGKNVRNIGNNAFYYCDNLTSITLPNMLESIGEWAFFRCSLTSVNIPGSVKTIDDLAFYFCGALASVNFEEGITSIGSGAFSQCAFTSITIPNSVTSIGSGAFMDNYSLTTAILGDGITEIAREMFYQCINLTSVIIPDGVTCIGERAFEGCRNLTSIKLPESLTSIGESAFFACPLKSIELPNSFTVIPENSFSNNNFQYIKLGDNVQSIGRNAFGCMVESDEDRIVIEIATSTPPAIDKDAFPNLEFLEDINVIVPDAAAVTAYRKKAVWEDMTFTHQDNNAEVTVDTPGDLSYELLSESGLKPAQVVGLKVNGTINADDFRQMLVNMKSLLRLDLSDCDITEIPDGALGGKTQLQELTLPDGLQTIGKNAFQGCPYLTGKLNLPSDVTTIGDYAFEGTNYTLVKMPYSLKTIGDYAFYNLPIKQELILPDKVSSVGAYAFAGTQIEDLEIPDGITSIGDHAFADTPIQDHVTIPDGIKELGEGAFRNSKLATVFLPNSITSVSRDLFQGCTNLNKVYIPDNFTEVSGYAFDGCEALKILRLSANTASMGEYAFQSAPMTKIKVPSQVEVLPCGVFKNCKNLVSVSLPANLTTVENEALYGCTALRNLSVEAIEPPTISNRSAIRGINTDLCVISIPTQSYRAYVLADYWGQFVEMRNDIAVETAGNGEIAFESVVEGEDEGVAESRTRSGQLATEDDAQTSISNGSSVYVPQDGQVRFYITPAKGETLLSATLDGVDITNDIVDGVYVATADKKNAKLVVKFSGTAPEPETYDITFDGSDSWATYVAQVDLALPTGITAYTVTSIETTSVTATAINYIPKDIPVLLKREDTNTNLYQASAGEGTAPTTNLLKVYDTDKTVSNREGYVLYKDEFVLVNAGTLPAGKVFLPANDSGSASTRSIVIEGEGTTGINSSILRNADGSNGLLYDLQGRKLSGKPVQKGVYILNGRKVVVK